MVSTDTLREEQQSLKILLVDDLDGVRRNTSSNLGKLGHQVLAAASAEEAMQLLEQHDFDVALVDVVMPGGADGLFLTSRIHQEYPHLPVVVYSGAALEDLKDKAERSGAVDFVKKPFDLMDLNRRLLGAVVEHGRAGRGPGSAGKKAKASTSSPTSEAREIVRALEAGTGTLQQSTAGPERERIIAALEQAGGHLRRAATILGIGYSTLQRKMKKHGIERRFE